MGFINKTVVLGSLVAFAKSPKGRELTAKAKQLASDPVNQQKAKDLAQKVLKKR